jgi:hypothetical protein
VHLALPITTQFNIGDYKRDSECLQFLAHELEWLAGYLPADLVIEKAVEMVLLVFWKQVVYQVVLTFYQTA